MPSQEPPRFHDSDSIHNSFFWDVEYMCNHSNVFDPKVHRERDYSFNALVHKCGYSL